MFSLRDFVRESNMIEGIAGVSEAEIAAHERFLALPWIDTSNLEQFVTVIQPGAKLRSKPGMDVRVGSHRPPPGGIDIVIALKKILHRIPDTTPFSSHLAYENLHPFTDGNGRSGRALWLWQIGGQSPLGFLHAFYYQTLKELANANPPKR